MTELAIDDFEEFFREIWREPDREPVTPFPWQLELARQVHTDRRWPDLVDLPTGSGKTSLLDTAVFLLALDAQAPAARRWMPRRVVLVVDRRVVVDQADERGAHLVARLASSGEGIVGAVADRLRSLSGGGPPLVRTVLRGGIVRDETWAQRPDVPAVMSSTVDQVGSRLLFRGYGLSAGMRPIHAGLLGNDALFLLDEVHLARPFAETLQAVRGYRGWRSDDGHVVPDRWHVVQLTATPTMSAETRFPTARLDPGSHPVLSRRLHASKPATLEIVNVAKDTAKANEQLAVGCVKMVRTQLELDHVNTLGVIVNRVDAARHVARLLKGSSSEIDIVLLTGRMRGLDRDRVLHTWGERLRMGRVRQPDEKPLVVVATQSIEAGADFDLDGVITECASLDALRQRFGRVDRDGRLADVGTPSSSVIVIRSTDVGATTPDPVYGMALTNTWSWLVGLDAVDFGIEELMSRLVGVDQHSLVPQPSRSPRLCPGHLDQWVQTSLRPASTEADVGRWLHGVDQDERLADVELVWRADLHPSLLAPEQFERHNDDISARIAACPPVSGEALSVSIVELRRWAAGEPSDPTSSDASGGGTVGDEEPQARSDVAYVRWSRGRAERVLLREVRPGDTLLVPAAAGGLWLDNWDPRCDAAVVDVALEGALRQRRRAVARLVRDLVDGDLPDPDVLEDESKGERVTALKTFLRAANVDDGHTRAAFDHLARRPTKELRVRALVDAVIDDLPHRSYVITSMTPVERFVADLAPEDGADAVSFTGARHVALDAHLRGVAGCAAQLAANLGASEELVADLRLAGRLHDLGKADSRFQRWLRGGQLSAVDDELLAKSPTPDLDRLARMKARELSGYPAGARHELLSLAMILDANGPVEAAHDHDLVRYLVTTHHGHGRYRFAPCIDPTPEDVRIGFEGDEVGASSDHGLLSLDAGVPEMFWRMVRRYGWYGLTWLESILRLADHIRSRKEQEEEIIDDAQMEATA